MVAMSTTASETGKAIAAKAGAEAKQPDWENITAAAEEVDEGGDSGEGFSISTQAAKEKAGAEAPKPDSPSGAEAGKAEAKAELPKPTETPAAPLDPKIAELAKAGAEPSDDPVSKAVVEAKAKDEARAKEVADRLAAEEAARAAKPAPEPAAGIPTLEQIEARREQVRASLVEQYRLSEEEEAEVMTEPGKALPKLASMVHMRVGEAVTIGILSQLPGMIEHVLSSRNGEEASRAKFYDSWPDLKDGRHEPTIKRIAQAYRFSNPNASEEEAIRDVGAAAMIALRIMPAGQRKEPSPAPAFVPAGVGNPAAPVTSGAKQDENPFSVLAAEFVNDDD
jgi:hypothetical protein